MFVSTHDPLTLSRSLTLPVYPWSQDLREPQTPPPHFLDSLVQDPCGPARLLCIREDFLDNGHDHKIFRGENLQYSILYMWIKFTLGLWVVSISRIKSNHPLLYTLV